MGIAWFISGRRPWEWRGGSSQDLSGEQRMPSVTSPNMFQVACAALLALALSATAAGPTSLIKDLPNNEGVRQNHLIGYGLLLGPKRPARTLNNIPFPNQYAQ